MELILWLKQRFPVAILQRWNLKRVLFWRAAADGASAKRSMAEIAGESGRTICLIHGTMLPRFAHSLSILTGRGEALAPGFLTLAKPLQWLRASRALKWEQP